MRLLAIGDIHGCLRSLTTLLAAVEPRAEDRLITLGDYVDRGPDSRGVLDCLIALHETGRLIALRGNHEVMMLDARHGGDLMWLACGGRQALRSYGIADWQINDFIAGAGWFGDRRDILSAVPARHWQFIEEDCVAWHETERHFFVHANAHPDVPLAEQPDYMLYWEMLTEACVHQSGKVMVCGHTRQKSGRPLDLGTTTCLDTGAHAGDWLTCLDVLTGRIWQANELGEARTGWLWDCA